ncbi:MAG: 4Fe-4S dicluster domain-containing protein [Spirochaetales bacterium]|nr:4Fe-4S dicluster domain-containing protein [Spirochaetales bacterium]
MSHVVIKKELCKGCSFCIKACPKSVLSLSSDINNRGFNYAEYAGEGCTGCGFCFYSCPELDAIEVYS